MAALTDSKSNATTTDTINTEGPQSNSSLPYKCHNCGTRVHRARDCFTKKRAGFWSMHVSEAKEDIKTA